MPVLTDEPFFRFLYQTFTEVFYLLVGCSFGGFQLKRWKTSSNIQCHSLGGQSVAPAEQLVFGSQLLRSGVGRHCSRHRSPFLPTGSSSASSWPFTQVNYSGRQDFWKSQVAHFVAKHLHRRDKSWQDGFLPDTPRAMLRWMLMCLLRHGL